MKKNAQYAIRKLLADRAPNWVSEATIRKRVDISRAELDEALQQLVAGGQLIEETDTQNGTGSPCRYFKLQTYTSIPIRETITLGTTEIPRILSCSTPKYAPENINEAMEQLADQSKAMKQQFEDAVREQHQRYWGNVVGLFGIFASVIALVVATLPNLEIQAGYPFLDNVCANLSVLLPAGVVLGLFVVFARWVVR